MSTPRQSSTPVKRTSTPRRQIAGLQLTSMQIVFGSILAISLLLAINFSGRIAAGRQIESERGVLQQHIGTLGAQATALRYELNYVSGDTFVEQWARQEGKMVKDREVLVIVVPGKTTPMPQATPYVAVADNQPSETDQNWQLWWQLFFDAPPPQNGQ